MAPATNPGPGGDNPPDDPESYVGLSAEQAEQRAAEHGWYVVRILPSEAVITMEYVAVRLNLSVENGRVVRCWQG